MKIPVSVLVVMYSPSGAFLLIERADKAGYWQSVTGSLDALDEPPIVAAQRELFEEVGVKAEVDDTQAAHLSNLNATDLKKPLVIRPWPKHIQYEIFPHWRHRYAPGVTHNTEHWFHVCLPDGFVPTLAEREHVGYAWLASDEAQERCFSPNNAQAIAELAAKI